MHYMELFSTHIKNSYMNIDLEDLTEYTRYLSYSYTIDYSIPLNIHDVKNNIIMFEYKFIRDNAYVLTSCLLDDFTQWKRNHRIDQI